MIQGMTVHYGMNADAFEGGAHLATVSVDLLTAEQREQSINQVADQWRKHLGVVPEAQNIAIKEPIISPAVTRPERLPLSSVMRPFFLAVNPSPMSTSLSLVLSNPLCSSFLTAS